MKVPADYQPTEHQIMNAIIGYLWAKRYYVQRQNSGKIKIYDSKARSYRMIGLMAPGTPDIMAFKATPDKFGYSRIEILYVEVKRPGNKPTLLQQIKMKELESFGARCIVATCAEDLMRAGI